MVEREEPDHAYGVQRPIYFHQWGAQQVQN
jgi:hypothetical protein